MTRPPSARHAAHRWARALLITAVIAMITWVPAPAGASIRIQNFAVGKVGVEDSAPLYAYWSGASAAYDDGRAFRQGTFSSTSIDTKQGLAMSQIVGGAVSVSANNEGTVEFGSGWGRAWAIPGAPSATATSVALDANGTMAVAIINSSRQVLVARQIAPGVWAPIPVWVTAGVNATDVEMTANPNGLLSLSFVQYLTGSTIIVHETAVGVWGTPIDLVGTVPRTGIAVTAAGLRYEMAVGSSTLDVWLRYETTPGNWADWAQVCSGSVPFRDISVMINSTGYVQAYLAASAGIYTCRLSAGGWTMFRTHTGNYNTVSAARLESGQTIVSATTSANNLSTSTGNSIGGAGSWGGWSETLATAATDHEIDGANVGNKIRLQSVGTTSFATSGTWTSPVIDTGGGGVYGLLRTRAVVPTATTARFQVAASNSATPTSYVGPDGTSATFFAAGDAALPYAFDRLRYARVRVTLTGNGSATPLVSEVSVGYNLDRAPRSTEGRAALTATAGTTSWVSRLSSTSTWLGTAASKLSAATTSTWGTNVLGASYDTAAPSCCSPSQFTVASGSATATAAAGVAPIVQGGNSGQSVVFNRLTVAAGTADFSSQLSLSTSLHVDLPQRAALMFNVARTATASQSSVYYNPVAGCCVATAAIDGTTSGVWTDGGITHTNTDPQPWWTADLGSSKQLSEIRLWNRTDCCNTRLSDFALLTSNSPIPTTSFDAAVATVAAAGGQVQLFPGTALTTESFAYPPGTAARYVQVILRNRAVTLSLAEVEVLGL